MSKFSQIGDGTAADDSDKAPVRGAPTGGSEAILARGSEPHGRESSGESTGLKPPHQRPELPDFWDHRFDRGHLPWDAGGVPQSLADFARTHRGRPRTLIPGCGSAHEAALLDRLGWPVTALDFSASAIAAARDKLGAFGGELLQADFFAFAAAAPFDLIYERAFLCALPRKLWPLYAPRCAELLGPRGLLAGFFFFGDDPKGPPFAIDRETLEAMLSPHFERIADTAPADSIALFAGRERWQVWRRR